LSENDTSGPHYWATYFYSKSYVPSLAKTGLGCVLGIFSQTHLVTLAWTSFGFSVTVRVHKPGLPDGIFSDQKSQFGKIFDGP
jgi:hypothetical protein